MGDNLWIWSERFGGADGEIEFVRKEAAAAGGGREEAVAAEETICIQKIIQHSSTNVVGGCAAEQSGAQPSHEASL